MTEEAARFAEVVVRELRSIRSSEAVFNAVVEKWESIAKLKAVTQLARQIRDWPELLHPDANLEDFGADVDRANWHYLKESLN